MSNDLDLNLLIIIGALTWGIGFILALPFIVFMYLVSGTIYSILWLWCTISELRGK